MKTKEGNFVCYDDLGICCPEEPSSFYIQNQGKKPLEIYIFIDPLCPECWALEPIIKKLQMEYANYFKIRTFLGYELKKMNPCTNPKNSRHQKQMAQSYDETATRTGMPCDGDVWYEQPISMPYNASLAVKAAELQGGAVGSKYLRLLREALFLHKQNIADEEVLIKCAEKIKGLDIGEFKCDLHSESAAKALKADACTTKEMDVQSLPTLVFFSDNVDEPGLSVPGLYDYSVYVDIITDMLGFEPEKCPPISVERFVKFYTLVASKEIAVVFDMTCEEADREMKKLQIQQKVECVPVKFGNLWRYVG
ncbi:ClpXP adapter SpxH family protein [Alteribacter keqinensis]|uniref:ClpXP adapter protein SpxH n=1 Tax=Alteribacter keqinensis TaxID=2483800 RepID=A0A3M7TX91_9BACI|nr:ClpXP adapter SpxH family protein [Alteribacter keqinensis]RNA69889.1 DsbA family protein [Alteribacter keqinensis]